MAIVPIEFAYPDIMMPSSAAIAYTTGALNGTSDVQGWVTAAEESITITKVGCLVTARTGSPGNVASGVRLGIVYIDNTTGFPATTPVWADGTFSGSAGTAYQDFNATTGVTTGVFLEATLTTPVAITKGTVFGIMIDPVSGTWDTTNLLTVARGVNTTFPYIRFPYGFEITSTAYALVNSAAPIFYYKSATKTYGYPYQTFTGVNNNSGSTPDEYGMYFRIPTGVCSTYNVRGMRLGFVPGTADFDVLLYDTNGTTVLQSISIDGNQMHTGNGAAFDFIFSQTTLATLSAGSYYRLVVRPSTATSMGSIQYAGFAASADKEAVLGNASDVQYTSRTNAGAWTEDTTRLWTMQALISGMDAGSTGSGGVKTHPGMTGGMRG